jgi:hypothetical protein
VSVSRPDEQKLELPDLLAEVNRVHPRAGRARVRWRPRGGSSAPCALPTVKPRPWIVSPRAASSLVLPGGSRRSWAWLSVGDGRRMDRVEAASCQRLFHEPDYGPSRILSAHHGRWQIVSSARRSAPSAVSASRAGEVRSVLDDAGISARHLGVCLLGRSDSLRSGVECSTDAAVVHGRPLTASGSSIRWWADGPTLALILRGSVRSGDFQQSLHPGGSVSRNRAEVFVGACLREDDRQRRRFARLDHLCPLTRAGVRLSAPRL